MGRGEGGRGRHLTLHACLGFNFAAAFFNYSATTLQQSLHNVQKPQTALVCTKQSAEVVAASLQPL